MKRPKATASDIKETVSAQLGNGRDTQPSHMRTDGPSSTIIAEPSLSSSWNSTPPTTVAARCWLLLPERKDNKAYAVIQVLIATWKDHSLLRGGERPCSFPVLVADRASPCSRWGDFWLILSCERTPVPQGWTSFCRL